MLGLIWSVGLLAALILYFREVYSKFERQGVKTDKVVPVFGSMGRIILGLDHVAENHARAYFEFPEEKFIGRFLFTSPILLLRDLELIQKVTVKDFDHFVDHRLFFDEDTDPLFSNALICLKGKKWKHVRSTIQPLYTSAKLRKIVPFILDAGDKMIHYLKKTIKESGLTR